MYSILIKERENAPVVISQDDAIYIDYLMAGYQEVTTGTKKYCNAILDETITAYAD